MEKGTVILYIAGDLRVPGDGELFPFRDDEACVYRADKWCTDDRVATLSRQEFKSIHELNTWLNGASPDRNEELIDALDLGIRALCGIHLECELGGLNCLECTAIHKLKVQRNLAKGGG